MMDSPVALIFAWAWCAVLAAVAAEQKQATGRGLVLGLLFGPLGVVVACFIDARPNCPRCGGRINSSREEQYPICQHCGTELFATTDASAGEPALAGSFLRDE